MASKKLICHVEFLIGEKMTESELQPLIEKGFDHAISGMIKNMDLTIQYEDIFTEGFEENEFQPLADEFYKKYKYKSKKLLKQEIVALLRKNDFKKKELIDLIEYLDTPS